MRGRYAVWVLEQEGASADILETVRASMQPKEADHAETA